MEIFYLQFQGLIHRIMKWNWKKCII